MGRHTWGAPGAGGRTGGLRRFEGDRLNEIAFPLGGVGAGTISLGGRGDLRDFEILNRPAKGRGLPFTFAAIRLQGRGARPLVRVLEGAPPPPYGGPFGFPRDRAQGIPRFERAGFLSAYPFAAVVLEDGALPVRVTLEAFNPLLPLEVDDSALPLAILRYRVENRSRRRLRADVAFSLLNGVGWDGRGFLTGTSFEGFGGNENVSFRDGARRGLLLSSRKTRPGRPLHGSLALATTGPGATVRAGWEEGPWFTPLESWHAEFLSRGRFRGPTRAGPTPDGRTNAASLSVPLELAPRGAGEAVFLLAWHFPVFENYWNKEPEVKGRRLRNHYADLFPDAGAVVRRAARDLGRLERGTRVFARALHGSTLPGVLTEAAAASLSVLRSTRGSSRRGWRSSRRRGRAMTGGGATLSTRRSAAPTTRAPSRLFPSSRRRPVFPGPRRRGGSPSPRGSARIVSAALFSPGRGGASSRPAGRGAPAGRGSPCSEGASASGRSRFPPRASRGRSGRGSSAGPGPRRRPGPGWSGARSSSSLP